MDGTDQHMIHFNFINIGGRPAANVHGKVYFVDEKMTIPPTVNLDITTSNVVPPNQSRSWHFTNKKISHSLAFHYVAILFKYSDIATNENYRDVFYLKWNGPQENVVLWDFSEAELVEKGKIEKVLREYLK
jgi:hypothetical protein